MTLWSQSGFIGGESLRRGDTSAAEGAGRARGEAEVQVEQHISLTPRVETAWLSTARTF